MATYRNDNIQNLAIGCTIWTLTMNEARLLKKWMRENLPKAFQKGSYWNENFVRVHNRALYGKKESVSIRTAGFTTGEFNNCLSEAGIDKSEVTA